MHEIIFLILSGIVIAICIKRRSTNRIFFYGIIFSIAKILASSAHILATYLMLLEFRGKDIINYNNLFIAGYCFDIIAFIIIIVGLITYSEKKVKIS